MSNKTIVMTPELNTYLQRCSLREPAILEALRDQTSSMSMSQMQISPEQGQLMAFLVELIGAKKTLEIGVFTGYSALVVALALPEEGRVIACDTNVEWTKIAKQYWEKANVSHKIDLRLAPALETLDQLLEEGGADTFDFAFIDADKMNYTAYYEKCLQLIRKGGLIAIDNVLWSGKVADLSIQDDQTINMRQFNMNLLHDKRVSISLIPIADGLTLVRKC